MIDFETLAQKYSESVIECNPDAVNAMGLIATSYLTGCNQGLLGGPIGEPHLTNLTFGQAVEHLKQGRKVARSGWKGFLWLKPEATVKAEWCKDPMLKGLAEANGGEIEALGTICKFTEEKQILSGWLASQTDILAEDWEIVISNLGN